MKSETHQTYQERILKVLVHIQNQVVLYINDGTQFKPQ